MAVRGSSEHPALCVLYVAHPDPPVRTARSAAVSGGLLLIFVALAYFFVILAEARFNVKGLGDRLPAFVWITLMISIGFQCFFFGFMLQLIKELKYRLDRVGRRVGSSSAEYDSSIVEVK